MCKKLVGVFLTGLLLLTGCMKPRVTLQPYIMMEEGRTYGNPTAYWASQFDYARRLWADQVELTALEPVPFYGFGTDPETMGEFVFLQEFAKDHKAVNKSVAVYLCRSVKNYESGDSVLGVTTLQDYPIVLLMVPQAGPSKVLAHELGHAFGLPHLPATEKNCPWMDCTGPDGCHYNVMNYCMDEIPLEKWEYRLSNTQKRVTFATINHPLWPNGGSRVAGFGLGVQGSPRLSEVPPARGEEIGWNPDSIVGWGEQGAR